MAISFEILEAPYPKIVLNRPWAYTKLHCKVEPHQSYATDILLPLRIEQKLYLEIILHINFGSISEAKAALCVSKQPDPHAVGGMQQLSKECRARISDCWQLEKTSSSHYAFYIVLV